ncbi:MAG: GTPase Era [Deltaproteobacteria bacterium]|jgi:GTP-binding protein Era|nr:GTPase Era [Deltaproteobacteria bacterium]
MAEKEKKEGFKSGFVAIIGRPNAGKSTLLNTLLGEKVAIISNKPQTTRNRILGIKNQPAGQIIFLDTPGIHQTRSKLNQAMVKVALATYNEVDVICFLIEADRPDQEENDYILETLNQVKNPVLLVINKIDLVPKGDLLPIIDNYSRLRPFEQIIPLSALRGDGVDVLLAELIQILPEGPKLFPEDMITDLPERFLAAELIREKVFLLTREEIPYSTAVVVEEFKEKAEKNLIVIKAAIQVERESQKGILIGGKGRMLKKIGRLAREEIEALLGAKVFLELWVKVEKNWREDPRALRRLGLE